MQLLKADTLTKVVIGPVVAVGDGFTPVTTLALTTADEAEAMKHDAAAVTDISGNTFAAITAADGYYNLTLTAAQLDTEGRLTVLINDDSLCLPVRADFMVVNANVFDSLYAAATTDYLQTDAVQFAGQTITAGAAVTIPASIASPTNITAGTITTATNLTNLPTIPANWLTAAGIAASALDGKGDWNTTTPPTSTAIRDAILDRVLSGNHDTAGTVGKLIQDIVGDTNELQTDDVPGLIAALNDISVADLLTTAMTEAYAADGVAPTLAQALFLIMQHLSESSISGTTKTVKKLDGSTTAATFTLDDATTPTSITRTT